MTWNLKTWNRNFSKSEKSQVQLLTDPSCGTFWTTFAQVFGKRELIEFNLPNDY